MDKRDRDAVLLGRAVDADAKESDALGKLSRYERGLERSLFRNLDELRQRQDRRRNRSSPQSWMPSRSPQTMQNDHRSTHFQRARPKHTMCRQHLVVPSQRNFLFCQTKPCYHHRVSEKLNLR